jgi:hypothetical protein
VAAATTTVVGGDETTAESTEIETVTGTDTTSTTHGGVGGAVSSSIIGKITHHSDANSVRPVVGFERGMVGGYGALVAGAAVAVGMASIVARLF